MSHNNLESLHREILSGEGKVSQGVVHRSSCESGVESQDKFWKLPKIKPNSGFLKVPQYLKALKVMAHLNALLSCVTILLSWGENQWTAAQSNSQTFVSDFLRFLALSLSLLQVVLVRRYYAFKLQLQVVYGLVQSESKGHTAVLLNSSLGGWVLLEAGLMCLCTPPLVYYGFSVQHHNATGFLTVGDVVVGFTFLRAYQLIYVLCWTEMPRDRFYL